MAVYFFSEQITLPAFKKRLVKAWVAQVLNRHNRITGNINFIFTHDELLLEINNKYLNHNYYTDIITFNYSNEIDVNGDIYISIDRVNENAAIYKTQNSELFRVMIHGVLHLIGYDDNNEENKTSMRDAEDECLKLLEM